MQIGRFGVVPTSGYVFEVTHFGAGHRHWTVRETTNIFEGVTRYLDGIGVFKFRVQIPWPKTVPKFRG